MFSKEESAKFKTLFWTSFGKSFPRKWMLYRTEIKDFSFKFVANNKKAMVCLDIESKDKLLRTSYYNKLVSLKNILTNGFIKDIIFDDDYLLENGKSICRIYSVHTTKFSIHNKNTWQNTYLFFIEKMEQFELFYNEYEDFIKG